MQHFGTVLDFATMPQTVSKLGVNVALFEVNGKLTFFSGSYPKSPSSYAGNQWGRNPKP